jgi:hypothetical protein
MFAVRVSTAETEALFSPETWEVGFLGLNLKLSGKPFLK